VTLEVVANIGNVEGAESAVKNGAEGVGLLRTEFLYLERNSMPTEEEQYQAYRAILDVFGDMPVILRTLDVGGDKEITYMNLESELNSFLGQRALRLCLVRPDIFKPQLRAALRAGVDRNLSWKNANRNSGMKRFPSWKALRSGSWSRSHRRWWSLTSSPKKLISSQSAQTT
jgi:phosphoenolpyruvate-protein kinase (PTS system EI component)